MDVDAKRLRDAANRLRKWRERPPTFLGVVLSFRSLPLLTVLGIGSYFLLNYVVSETRGAMPTWLPTAMVAVCFGAALRDIGNARLVARFWPAQSQFIDWVKVDSCSSHGDTTSPAANIVESS